MAMVQVGIVRVLADEQTLPVPMAVRLSGRIAGRVFMLVMDVMGMAMIVLDRLMQMFMGVGLGKVEIDAEAH